MATDLEAAKRLMELGMGEYVLEGVVSKVDADSVTIGIGHQYAGSLWEEAFTVEVDTQELIAALIAAGQLEES